MVSPAVNVPVPVGTSPFHSALPLAAIPASSLVLRRLYRFSPEHFRKAASESSIPDGRARRTGGILPPAGHFRQGQETVMRAAPRRLMVSTPLGRGSPM